jgi:hypothetical protein
MQRVKIRIKGRIDEQWSEWFGDLAVTHTDSETILTGVIKDQAEVYGLLARLRDLGLSLASVDLEEVNS